MCAAAGHVKIEEIAKRPETRSICVGKKNATVVTCILYDRRARHADVTISVFYTLSLSSLPCNSRVSSLSTRPTAHIHLFSRHWTAGPESASAFLVRLARAGTHQPRRRLGRRAPHGCRSAWSMAWSRARANPAAAKCKPGVLLSAKQEGADFRRARKLGQRHELVHHLLQQLAPG